MNTYNDLTTVNSSEAYIGELLFVGMQLIVPIINVGLLPGHLLNLHSSEQVFVDYSYLCFNAVQAVSCEGAALGTLASNLFTRDAQVPGLVFYCGAYNIFYPQDVEFRLVADSGNLVLPPGSQLATAPWVPLPTPQLRQNMVDSFVQPFLRAELWAVADCE